MALTMVWKHQDPEAFWRHWDVCVDALKAGPCYARSNIEWALAISTSRASLVSDMSCIFLRDGTPLAAAFLPIETVNGRRQIGRGGSPAYAPLIVERGVMKEVYAEIEALAKREQVERIAFEIDPMMDAPYNDLQRFGYLDASLLQYVMDTAAGPNLLLKCRHGHQYDIKRMLKDPRVNVIRVDRDAPDAYEQHEMYRKLHEKCSGRRTRPIETFDMQFQQLKNGEAELFILMYDGKPAVCAYFQHQNGKAVYASGADDPDFAELPLYHPLLFTALEYLKGIGVRYIDTGQPSGPSPQFQYDADAKQLRIAQFKRGFPGDFHTAFRGIRYLTREAFVQDMETFQKNYSETL